MKVHARMILAAGLAIASVVSWRNAYAAQYTDTTFRYGFVYPDSWHLRPSDTNPGQVFLTNFPEDQWLQGGSPPFGGAEIIVNVFPPYPPGWSAGTDEYAHLHALATQVGTILSETTRNSGSPARVKWTRETLSGTTNTQIWTVLRIGGRVFELGVDYQSADPAASQYEQVFSDLLASLSVVPPSTP